MKNAVRIALIGLVYLYLSRTIATYLPEIFLHPITGKVNSVLSLFSILSFIWMYYAFYTKYSLPHLEVVGETQSPLKSATKTAIIGMVFLLPLYLESISLHYLDYHLPTTDRLYISRLFLAWASSLCTLYFTVIFYDETNKKVSLKLSKAAKIGIIGASLMVVMRTYLILNFYYSSQFRWSGWLGPDMPIIVITILIFVFYAQFNFMWQFYRELKSNELIV